MEQIATVLIYTHAFFGGLGLFTGFISVIVKKGGSPHKKAGKVFTYSMLLSSLLSLIIALMPNHENTFLLLIGIFTIYMILSGNRALTFNPKYKTKAHAIDKIISVGMLIIALIMLSLGVLGLIQKIENSILYLFFGILGSFMATNDFKIYRQFKERKNARILSHIGRMVGALIASFTAFLVAGLHIGSTIVWIAPTIVGTAYIIYTSRKYKK
ncbi:hypothetical protein E2P86_09365 [Sphingobacterium psychroaquaticum]|uniref:hypothetical protein n=1 Tax=Sphingobacterium psychroaquaticum TaxID=561061 RepID=UPI00106C1090|nr:hypothetical protein [Sphingobacterium psychroaquaticum]QBQ41353.1 hypothetical protein E2P86_09365 [Sphingobacterium psychroaquaticum]